MHFIHSVVEHHLLDSSDALATNTHNFSQNMGTECRQEISRMGRDIFVLSKCNLVQTDGHTLIVISLVQA